VAALELAASRNRPIDAADAGDADVAAGKGKKSSSSFVSLVSVLDDPHARYFEALCADYDERLGYKLRDVECDDNDNDDAGDNRGVGGSGSGGGGGGGGKERVPARAYALMQQLRHHLSQQSARRRAEVRLYNEQLAAAESKVCVADAARRVAEAKVAAAAATATEKARVNALIERQVYALLRRSAALETENRRLVVASAGDAPTQYSSSVDGRVPEASSVTSDILTIG
jgi:hypothetical protein